MIRLFDIFFSIFGLFFLLPLFFLISVIGFFNTGSPLFLQKRLGLNLKIFTLVKIEVVTQGYSKTGEKKKTFLSK